MNNKVSSEWVFKDLIWDIDKYYINGLNIWDYKWNYTGVFVEVVHPARGFFWLFC